MRKAPQQSRSRDMVEGLVEATARCVASRGLDATTTNHVAFEAGVSVGSLYQYFPNKDALVAAMLERMAADIRSGFSRRAETIDITQLPLGTVAEQAITFGLHRMRTDPLVREVVRNWNRLPTEKILDPLRSYFLTRAQPYFLRNYRDYPVEHLEEKLYVLIDATLLASIRHLTDDARLLTDERFIVTVTDMIVALLEHQRPAKRARRRSRAAAR